MLKYRLIILLNFIIFNLSAQNLVLNPSFENKINNCNFINPYFGTSHCTANWYNPNLLSPDFFYQGSSNLRYNIPLNGTGFQAPHSGFCYSGIMYHFLLDDNREYLEGMLLMPLKKHKKYCISFYLSLSDSSYYALDSIGLIFFNQPFFQNSVYWIQLRPDVATPSGVIFNDTVNWMSINLEYLSEGGEQYFVLGYFKRADYLNEPFIIGGGNLSQKYAYYYIDDVSITFCDTVYKAQAGQDTAICKGGSSVLGTRNFIDYQYKWFPSTGLNNDTLANPIASPSVTTTYTLELKDFFDTLTYDTVVVYVHNCANAGNNKITCGIDSVQIGSTAIANCTYHWQPINGLNNAQIAMPKALPNVSTTYTLTLSDNTGFTSTDEVVVQVLQHCDTANAGADTLICLGTTANIGTTPIQNANYLWLTNMG